MRCSSSERSLDAYVDGRLSPLRHARVGEHVAACAACSALLEEFRTIDALLLTPRQLAPAPNFSFRVMAEVRTLPAPQINRGTPLAVLGAYVVFAWVAIGTFLVFGGTAARAMLATISAALGGYGAELAALGTATGRIFGAQTFDVTAAMGAILAADLVAASCVVGFYAMLRARRPAIDRSIESC